MTEFMFKNLGRVRRAGLALVLISLSGCILQNADITPEGQLEVFGPSSGFNLRDLPGDWINVGLDENNLDKHLEIVSVDASPAMKVTPAPKDFFFLRRVNAGLLASPFLGWSWTRSPGAKERSKVSLLVGFYGGNPTSRSWGGEFFAFLGQKIPPHDRLVILNWGGETEQAGSVDKEPRSARMIVRSIRNSSGDWYEENVDIGRVYRDAWPKDDHADAKIMFVGFVAIADGGTAPSPLQFSDVVLYR